jgi:hypothetical protein
VIDLGDQVDLAFMPDICNSLVAAADNLAGAARQLLKIG